MTFCCSIKLSPVHIKGFLLQKGINGTVSTRPRIMSAHTNTLNLFIESDFVTRWLKLYIYSVWPLEDKTNKNYEPVIANILANNDQLSYPTVTEQLYK